MLFWIFTKMCEYFLILIWSSHLWDGNKTTHNFFFQCPSPPIYFRCGIRHNTSEASNLSVDSHQTAESKRTVCHASVWAWRRDLQTRALRLLHAVSDARWVGARGSLRGSARRCERRWSPWPTHIVKAIVTHPYQLRWVTLTGINCRKAHINDMNQCREQ